LKKPSAIRYTPSAPWHLYIAECADGSYYTGIAKDVEKRLKAHNEGKGAKYTRTHGPVTLLFREPQADYSTALKREYQVKRLPKARKKRFVLGEKLPIPRDKAKMAFQKPRKKKRRSNKRRRRPAKESMRKRPG
jgi:putative endonuclease